MAILTTHPDPEREPARRQLGERGDLAGHRQRMPQRQQVDGRAHADRPGQRSEGGGLDEPVEALPALERDVVPDAELVDAGRLRSFDNVAEIRRTCVEQLAWRAEPDANRRVHAHREYLAGSTGITLTRRAQAESARHIMVGR